MVLPSSQTGGEIFRQRWGHKTRKMGGLYSSWNIEGKFVGRELIAFLIGQHASHVASRVAVAAVLVFVTAPVSPYHHSSWARSSMPEDQRPQSFANEKGKENMRPEAWCKLVCVVCSKNSVVLLSENSLQLTHVMIPTIASSETGWVILHDWVSCSKTHEET